MTWTQTINPLGNLGLSALAAAVPVIFLFIALAGLRLKGHVSGLITVALAVLVASTVFHMPAQYVLQSAFYGILYGLFPIGWIIVAAVFLYNITVKTGQFEIIKDSIASITDDRRLQALLISSSFGAFIEGAAGFGTPVAITSVMLVGLGFNPLYAAGICLVANAAPVVFGGVGTPVITAGAVTGIDAMAISQMAGRIYRFSRAYSGISFPLGHPCRNWTSGRFTANRTGRRRSNYPCFNRPGCDGSWSSDVPGRRYQ